MKAIWQDTTIAESNDTIVVEGNHYFPFDALNHEFFTESAHTSSCGWKGLANYLSVKVNDKVNENAAWVYNNPKTAAADIKGYVAFWKGVKVVE
jgi:uncharacterized protein (DUF427 family)